MRVVRLVGVACAIAVLAACGGGGSATESDSLEVIGGALDGSVSEIESSGNNCVDAAAAYTAIVQGVTLSLMDPSAFDVEVHRENVRRALEVVPDEVAEEFQVVADAYLKVGDLLDEIGKTGGLTTPENLEKLNVLSAELEQPEVQEKAERLAEYFLNECVGG
jgi:hypothetical protein